MGKKAKLKKLRQQQPKTKVEQKYLTTEFVKQFEHMGYQVKVDLKQQENSDRPQLAPEIPQTRIEPQL